MSKVKPSREQKRKHHVTCGKKCSRNKGLRSWPLMPDGLTPGQAARWQQKYS